MDSYNGSSNNEINRYKKLSTIFLILAIVLAILLLFSLLRNKSVADTAKENAEQTISLQTELDSILLEYQLTKEQYGELNNQLIEKDSAIMAQAEEIKQLISAQSDYRRIKKKLELLQSQGQQYVHMLDSLYTVNEHLTKENQEIKSENSKLNEQNRKLNLTRDSLDNRIKTASRLKAYNIGVNGIVMRNNGKTEEATNRCRRVQKFKVSFTLGENAIKEAGNVNLYCRLSIPDGKVLAIGDGDAYSFTNEGKVLQYSIKTTVAYANKAQDVVMYWNLREGDVAVAGTYTAQLFTDDEYIGQASVTLK